MELGTFRKVKAKDSFNYFPTFKTKQNVHTHIHTHTHLSYDKMVIILLCLGDTV